MIRALMICRAAAGDGLAPRVGPYARCPSRLLSLFSPNRPQVAKSASVIASRRPGPPPRQLSFYHCFTHRRPSPHKLSFYQCFARRRLAPLRTQLLSLVLRAAALAPQNSAFITVLRAAP